MAEPTKVFFKQLAERGHEPLLQAVTGTILFDLEDGERTEHWYVTIKKGDVAVSHKGDVADCVLRTDLATFDAIMSGRMNAMACILRGLVDVEGKIILIRALQRLFPRPSGSSDERGAAGYARRLQ